MNFKEFKIAYLREEQERNITRRKHPENNDIVILRYTDRCIFKKNWNEITEACRDLIVNEATEEIVARGFSKFYNQRQRTYFNTAYLTKNYPNASVEFTDKIDGIQAVSYRLNGKIRFASEGSFLSESSRAAAELWEEHYTSVEHLVPDEITLVVEVIRPDLKVVVPYHFEDLILVGALNRHNGHDFDYAALSDLAATLGMQVPAKLDMTFEEAVAIADSSDYTTEGFVVRYGNDQRIKVKSKEYLRVFRLTHLTSSKQLMKLWVDDEFQEAIDSLPAEFQPDFIALQDLYESEYLKMLTTYEQFFQPAPKKTKKEFAIWVNKHIKTHQNILFKMYDCILTEKLVREAVFKDTYNNETD